MILYDLDAGGLFASPVPTGWSGDGEQELTSDEAGPRNRLGPDELETAGRAPIAEQVRGLRALGVDAWAWLPTSRDARDLAAYAERQGATLVLVPADLAQPGLVDRRVAGHAGVAEAGSAGSPIRFETSVGVARPRGNRTGRRCRLGRGGSGFPPTVTPSRHKVNSTCDPFPASWGLSWPPP